MAYMLNDFWVIYWELVHAYGYPYVLYVLYMYEQVESASMNCVHINFQFSTSNQVDINLVGDET